MIKSIFGVETNEFWNFIFSDFGELLCSKNIGILMIIIEIVFDNNSTNTIIKIEMYGLKKSIHN